MSDAAKNYRNQKEAKKKYKIKLLENMGIGTIAILAIIILFLLSLFFVGAGPKSQNGNYSVFVVENGDGISKVADRLKKENLVRAKLTFKIMAAMSGGKNKLQPGEYEIPSRASPSKIVDILIKGEAITHKITIPEGWSNALAYRRLANTKGLVGDLPKAPNEGMLAPDTYQFKRGDSREAIVTQMMARQNRIIDDLWLKRAANLPLRSKDEALVLASIVEKETGKADERPLVSSVFINRLRKGMKLQSDPTIIYGITKGVPLGRKILKSEITQNHPWNTYVIQGLPPTPIANPGRDALEAVLNPPNSKYLFFVADGTGGHIFAETYAEHERNVKKWRELRAMREAQDAQSELRGAN